MKKVNLHRLEDYFLSQNQPIFTISDVVFGFAMNKRSASVFLFNNVKKGAIIRLKAGLFSLPHHMPHEFVIANRLYMPSYISLDTALSFHGLIPETVYRITSITSKATKEFEVGHLIYSYNKIKREAFYGYELYNLEKGRVYIAKPEKAIADFLYFVYLGKRVYNDRLDWRNVDFKKVEDYLKLFLKKKLILFARKKFKEYVR
jgi:predicted transcriptional regulator of viral defense system